MHPSSPSTKLIHLALGGVASQTSGFPNPASVALVFSKTDLRKQPVPQEEYSFSLNVLHNV